MTYRAKLVVVCLLMLTMTLSSVGFGVWSAGELRQHLERSRLAHLVLEGHLRLQAHTYELFKQIGDSMLIGEHANHFDEPDTRAVLQQELASLRGLIAAEIAIVDADDERLDETDELHNLALLEEQVLDALRDFDRVRLLIGQGRRDEAWPILRRTLEDRIDQDFGRLIDAAVASEIAEVEETDRRAETAMLGMRWLSILLGVLAMAVTAVSLWVLLARLGPPSRALIAGTDRLSAGDFSFRIGIAGRDEFADLARNFNRMADRLQQHEQQRERTRDELERAVAERTEQLQAANAALQDAADARRRLFADISHELRTPLTVIRGEAEIILRGQPRPADEYQSTLRRIVNQVEHTSRLVDDLLFIARTDAGVPKMDMQAVALIEILERVCGDAEAPAAQRGITIAFATQVRDAVVTGDPVRLRQTFVILLDNAVRYSRPHGRIEVTVHPSPNGICVQVADNGIGIPADEIDRVFERYYRGHGADQENAAGVGLGLPIAKAIVEAHGGEISLTSRLGEGTQVSVLLPVSRRLQVVA